MLQLLEKIKGWKCSYIKVCDTQKKKFEIAWQI